MSAEIINGKKLASQIKHEVRKTIVEQGLEPGLAVFLVGDDPASHLYVKLKEKACKQVGIDFHIYTCEDDVSEESLLESVKFINNEPTTDAMLIQLPLPESFDEQKVINAMNPAKDVDGFHPETLKKIEEGNLDFVPGLSLGIIRLIESTKQEISGKQAVIVANSEIFSRPLVKLLQDKGASVETAFADDPDLEAKTIEADILIVAIGRPEFITAEMVKSKAIVIDVGTTKIDGELYGDVAFEEVKEKAGWITPVPGGVGPVTVAMLLENTLKLAQNKKQG